MSSIAVNNISDEIVLRRILQNLVQRVDVLEGRREDVEGTAAWRDSDRALAAQLTDSINNLRTQVNDALEQLQQLSGLSEILFNSHARSALMQAEWLSPTSVVLTQRYNILATATRVAVGIWEFEVEQETMYGINMLAASIPTLSWDIQPHSWNYNVVFTRNGLTKFRLTFIHGGSPVDLDTGDKVYFSLQFKRLAAGLPPA